jgi:3',5'-cyclic AMP phosphodiesterase CpdA
MKLRLYKPIAFRPLGFIAMLAALFSLAACAAPAASPAAQLPTSTPQEQATLAPTATPEPTPDPALAPVTFAWISDTQGYASTYPENLNRMTRWIVDNRERLNIQYVLQTGDLVNDMLREREWNTVATAFDAFVGKIPVFGNAGNHDIKGMMHFYDDNHALMSRQNYTAYPTFGGEEAQGRRRYDLVTIGHEDFIIIGAGYNQQIADYDWLNQTLKQYPDRTAILIAHWYLELKEGEELIADSKLLHSVVAENPNVRYVLCGHKHGLRHVEEQHDDDRDGTPERTVQTIMVDYQALPNGGEGYFMLLTFNVVDRTLSITSYSPVRDDFNYYADESLETFTMPLSTVGTDQQ